MLLISTQTVGKDVSAKGVPFVTCHVFTPVRFEESKKQMSAKSSEEQ